MTRLDGTIHCFEWVLDHFISKRLIIMCSDGFETLTKEIKFEVWAEIPFDFKEEVRCSLVSELQRRANNEKTA